MVTAAAAYSRKTGVTASYREHAGEVEDVVLSCVLNVARTAIV
jgi:hypothetical protein